MYRVFIVDDEPIAVIGIKMTFEWEKYGFAVVGETTDALSAVEMAEELMPDVVFTDVVMPDITGLELIKKMRQRKIDAEFVIVSGHNDFLYTKQAIQQGIFDYCLKPIKKSEAVELLERLKIYLDEKNGLSQSTVPEGIEIKNPKLKNIVEYINDNYADGIKLSKVAEKFGMNSNYLSTLFKQELGVSFSQYINNVKMISAAELLKSTDKNIEEIAYDLGMEYYYFMKIFRKTYKITPAQFRKKFSSDIKK